MKKKLFMILFCMILMLTGCSGGTGSSDTASDEQQENETEETENTEDTEDDSQASMDIYENEVKVMSYNIYYQNVEGRSDNIQDLIVKNSPDILMLQEVCVDWIPYIQEFMEENNYSYYGYGRYGGEFSADGLQSGEQFAMILWKNDVYELSESGHFWLSSTPDVYSSAWTDGTTSNYPRCVNWVILKSKETEDEIFALNAHTDPEDEMVRNNSCSLIAEQVEELRGERAAVLGGDWNMTISDTAYTIMTDTFLDVRFQANETTTEGSFNAWGEREEGNYAFGDHIFITDNIGAELYEVVDDYYDGEHISDHCPIQAVLYY